MFTNPLTSSSTNDVAGSTEKGGTDAMREADRPSSLTIEDVARLADVSVSSARNYFSRPQALSAPTHARIKAAVQQTGYLPRGSLAGLSRRQLGRIGFEVPRGEDPAGNPVFNQQLLRDRKSTRLNSSHGSISYAVF